MVQKFPWKKQVYSSPRTSFRPCNAIDVLSLWRNTIDEASCSVLYSRIADSDASRERAKTVHAGTGDECTISLQPDRRKKCKPHRLVSRSRRPAKYLGCRRACFHGAAAHKIQ